MIDPAHVWPRWSPVAFQSVTARPIDDLRESLRAAERVLGLGPLCWQPDLSGRATLGELSADEGAVFDSRTAASGDG